MFRMCLRNAVKLQKLNFAFSFQFYSWDIHSGLFIFLFGWNSSSFQQQLESLFVEFNLAKSKWVHDWVNFSFSQLRAKLNGIFNTMWYVKIIYICSQSLVKSTPWGYVYISLVASFEMIKQSFIGTSSRKLSNFHQ